MLLLSLLSSLTSWKGGTDDLGGKMTAGPESWTGLNLSTCWNLSTSLSTQPTIEFSTIYAWALFVHTIKIIFLVINNLAKPAEQLYSLSFRVQRHGNRSFWTGAQLFLDVQAQVQQYLSLHARSDLQRHSTFLTSSKIQPCVLAIATSLLKKFTLKSNIFKAFRKAIP